MSRADPLAELRLLYVRERLERRDVEAIARHLATLHRRGERAVASVVLIAILRRHEAHVRDHVVDELDVLVGPTPAAIAAGKAWAERALAQLRASASTTT
jgi:hypothetical protein